MLKLLASVAVGAVLATGAFAQTQDPATDPIIDPAAPAADAPGADATMAPEADTTMAPAAPGTPIEVTGDWVVDGNYQVVDVAGLTAEEITGADIRNPEGEVVATVADIVLGADGKVESVAARFGGFLGFGTNTVLLNLDEVEFMKNDSGTVVLRSNITPESLEGRPDYEGPA